MEKEEIDTIAKWACQPRRYVWRKWLGLILPLGVPREELLMYKPEMVEILEPLLGRLVKTDTGFVNTQLSKESRITIFKEALEIIEGFHSWSDLATAAAYRRQVSNYSGIDSIDSHFFRLVRIATPLFDSDWLRTISLQMPPGGEIHRQLTALARERQVKTELIPLLAAD